jgi:hypothetical protein
MLTQENRYSIDNDRSSFTCPNYSRQALVNNGMTHRCPRQEQRIVWEHGLQRHSTIVSTIQIQ